MSQKNKIVMWACGFSAALGLMATGRVSAQAPHVGQVERLTVITISMQVGSMETETKRVAYATPPGWYVRGHQVNCAKKGGNSSYSVNTIPSNWAYVTEEKVDESYKLLIDLAGQAQNVGLKVKFITEREQLLAEIHKVYATHHALVVEATVRGEGFMRNGGSLELMVTAELVYIGTEESLAQTVARHKAALK